MRKFERHFPKQAKNIDDCKQLDEETKAKFFKEIEGITSATDTASEKQTVKDKANEYFHNNQFTGQQLTLKKSERLGRLQSWNGFINHIEPLLPPRNKDIFDKDKLESIKRKVKHGDLSAAEEIFNLVEEALKPYLIPKRPLTLGKIPKPPLTLGEIPIPPLTWCFRADTPAPFEGIHLDSLPCRLGLKYLDIQKYLPIEITPPLNIVAKIPTAFDAGLFVHWRPGGKTCHRDGCECQQKDGLDEVVIMDGLTYDHAKPPKI
ncbi:MAG: hypothetical protein HOP34_12510 [Methylococcaceae bacterium]|nr:hypothetical protein [Methylococcaceae bacterium]